MPARGSAGLAPRDGYNTNSKCASCETPFFDFIVNTKLPDQRLGPKLCLKCRHARNRDRKMRLRVSS